MMRVFESCNALASLVLAACTIIRDHFASGFMADPACDRAPWILC